MAKKVLVTGANGFVGSHILEALITLDDVHVIAACRDKNKLLPGYTGEVREGDLLDAQYNKAVVKDVDIICHAAAWSSMWGHKDASHRLYLEPTLALIDNAHKAGVSCFINTSSTSAASPSASADPMSRGIKRPFWPHLCNMIAIENSLRELASPQFKIINLRLGIFAGRRYSLGVLPILLPRLKTHLVPWVAGGRTSMPITDGRDIGQAFAQAVMADGLKNYEAFNIVGPEIPTVREVIAFLHDEYGLPLPHFSVPFSLAYPFAWLMEKMDRLVPWEPLITRSIIHLIEEVSVSNDKAEQLLGYRPTQHWRNAISAQIAEMNIRQTAPMKMAREIP